MADGGTILTVWLDAVEPPELESRGRDRLSTPKGLVGAPEVVYMERKMQMRYKNDVQLLKSSRVVRGKNSEVIFITKVCPAHPLGRVVVLAPNPLYGPSPGRWAGSAFALDSLREEAESRDPWRRNWKATGVLDASAPGLLCWALSFSTRGGLMVGRITFVVGSIR